MKRSTPQQVIPRRGVVTRTILHSYRFGVTLVEFTATGDKRLYVLGSNLRDGEHLDLRDPRIIDWSSKLDNARRIFNNRVEV